MSAGGLDALSARLPATRRLDRLSLGQFPTPVQPLERLGARLGAELWVKRDDLSGARYGGNKVRKLELLLADARERGARAVLTGGGIGSNHVLATAIYGRDLGMTTHAVVFRQPVLDAVRRTVRLCLALGVTLHPVATPLSLPIVVASAARQARRDGRRCYNMLPGGSTPLGTIGYVAAACELAEQIDAGVLPEPDRVWLPIGSAGTAVGLQLGFALAGLRTRVVAVRVGAPWLVNALLARGLRAMTERALGGSLPAVSPLRIVGDQIGRGYGAPTAAGREALELARIDGLELDATYSAKALAALIAQRKADPTARTVELFWNTYNSRPLEQLDAPHDGVMPRTIERWL